MADQNNVEARFGINLPLALSIAAFTAVAWVYALELNFRVLMTFKNYRGLYFWSLQISSMGIILHAAMFVIKFFKVTDLIIPTLVFIIIGWVGMVTGQSLVLYSRLHLLTFNQRRLRWVLYMIMVDAVLFHTPTTVLLFLSNLNSNPMYTNGFNIAEKIQMTAFSCQEFILSSIYIWETRKILKPRESFQKERVRKVMRHLIYINLLIIFLDVTLLACEYANLYEVEATLKPAIYAFKLRLEFSILNQLTAILCKGDQPISAYHRSGDHGGLKLSNMSRGGGHGHGISQRTYSVYAGNGGEDPGVTDDGCIKATTEVTVHRVNPFGDTQTPVDADKISQASSHRPIVS